MPEAALRHRHDGIGADLEKSAEIAYRPTIP
jgi:hypothetical protein